MELEESRENLYLKPVVKDWWFQGEVTESRILGNRGVRFWRRRRV